MIVDRLKDLIRKGMFYLGLDLTANQKMDRLTFQILREHLSEDSHAVDIGCHKGEVLDWILRFAPHGQHFAFEPIPQFFEKLKIRYAGKNCTFFPYALSDKSGETEFIYVPEAPAYSGLKERDYDGRKVNPQTIRVEMRRLDDLIPSDLRIRLIKIDVEGAELGVLKGAEHLLRRCKPIVVFEFGKGASDRYGTTPVMVFDFLKGIGMNVFSLRGFAHGEKHLDLSDFEREFETGANYYFVAR